MRTHWHNSNQNVHMEFMNRAMWDLKQIFTPPKGGDIWKSMTKGSTGGWAKPFAKPATLLPAAAALATIPFTGGASLPIMLGSAGGLGALQGATTGLWGKPGVGSALKGGLYGAAQGGGVAGLSNLFGASAANAIPTSAGGFISNPYPGAITGSQLATSGGYGLTGSGLATSGMGIGSTLGRSFAPTGISSAAQSINPAGGSSTYGASLATKGSGITNAFNAAAGTGTSATTSAPWYSKALEGINPYQLAIGGALSAYPALTGGETTQIPQSELYGQATSRLLGDEGFSALGKLGREQLTNQLSGQFEPVPDEYYNASKRRMDEAYDKAEKDFATSYKGLRPGANVENDSAFQTGVNKIREDRARETSALAADLDYRREMDYYDRKMQSINSSLNLDQQTMADYIALSQMDENRLAINTGISVGEATKFKEIFGDLGGMFMKKGLGLEDPNSVIQRMKGLVG